MSKQSNPFEILVVKDDPEDQLLLAFELQGSGLEKGVHFFSDVDELIGFESLKQPPRRKAVILLNLYLPKYDIHEAIVAVKSMDTLRSVPIIVVLGSQGEAEILKLFNLDVSGHIVKPVTLQQLQQAMSLRKTAHRHRSDPPAINHASG